MIHVTPELREHLRANRRSPCGAARLRIRSRGIVRPMRAVREPLADHVNLRRPIHSMAAWDKGTDAERQARSAGCAARLPAAGLER